MRVNLCTHRSASSSREASEINSPPDRSSSASLLQLLVGIGVSAQCHQTQVKDCQHIHCVSFSLKVARIVSKFHKNFLLLAPCFTSFDVFFFCSSLLAIKVEAPNQRAKLFSLFSSILLTSFACALNRLINYLRSTLVARLSVIFFHFLHFFSVISRALRLQLHFTQFFCFGLLMNSTLEPNSKFFAFLQLTGVRPPLSIKPFFFAAHSTTDDDTATRNQKKSRLEEKSLFVIRFEVNA
jgi:hypothetical protein